MLQCGVPGCALPRQAASATGALGGGTSGYCSAAHEQLARRKRLLAPATPDVEAVHIGPGEDWSVHLLRRSHPRHAAVRALFAARWGKPAAESGGCLPRVQAVLHITTPPAVFERFRRHAAALGGGAAPAAGGSSADDGQPFGGGSGVGTGAGAGAGAGAASTRRNVEELFHGTSQLPGCFFGVRPGARPCEAAGCAVCAICRRSLALARAGAPALARGNGGWLRFGRGLYFSSCSGKSNDYSAGSEKVLRGQHGRRWRWRVMLLCKVAVGRPFETDAAADLDEAQFTAAGLKALGFDSVLGAAGADLNYPETVVYAEEAVLPRELIVYTLPAHDDEEDEE
jgi:hypothetical protein